MNYGALGTAVTAVADTGYHFVSWSDGVMTATRNDTNSRGDQSVTATFAINTYTLTYTAGANGTISGTSPQTVNHGSSATTVTAVPATGYHFVSWSDGVGTAARRDTNVTASKTVTASFAIDTFTITASAGAHGTISPASATVNYGVDQSFTITPDTGYHVETLVVDGSAVTPETSYKFKAVTGPHTISATFAINTYTITSSAGAHGTISPVSPTVNYGADQPFTITPETGYHVETLTVDAAAVTPATSYTFRNVTAAHTISATFAINTYTLTYSAGAGRHDLGHEPADGQPRLQRDHGDRGTGNRLPLRRLERRRGHRRAQGHQRHRRQDRLGDVRHQHLHPHLHRGRRRHGLGHESPVRSALRRLGDPLTAVPATGYHFVSWSDGVATATRTDTNVVADKSVTANFAVNTYTSPRAPGHTAASPRRRRRLTTVRTSPSRSPLILATTSPQSPSTLHQ